MKRIIAAVVTVVVLLVGGEVALRLAGAVDFPLYDANAQIGYIPKASQSGSFLDIHSWHFNSLHMGAAPFAPSDKVDILLVGDSIVLGGNPISEPDRLGPQLAERLNASVWPISAGSWALRNELSYLRMEPQVVDQVDRVVFVLNSGDFEMPSSWACEYTHPRSKPISAIYYLAQKYVFSTGLCGSTPPDLLMPPGDVTREMSDYMSRYGAKTTVILYPDKNEIADHALLEKDFKDARVILANAGVRNIKEVVSDPTWTIDAYRDGIHPSAPGYHLLAQVIAKLIQ